MGAAGAVRAILDTSVLLASREEGIPDLSGIDSKISSISISEMQLGLVVSEGVERAVRAARLQRVMGIYGPGLAFDDSAAASFGALTALVVERGQSPRTAVLDRMIAATAHSLGVALVTRDKRLVVFEPAVSVVIR